MLWVCVYLSIYLSIYLFIFVGISKLYSDPSCTRLVFVDEKSDAFLYNPINDMIIQLPEYPVSAIGLLWDQWPLDKVMV